VGAVGHLDEGEAARPAGVPVGDDLGRGDRAVLAEHLAEVVGGGGEGQVAHVQFLTHGDPFKAARPRETQPNTNHPGWPGKKTQRGSRGTARLPDLPDRHRESERVQRLTTLDSCEEKLREGSPGEAKVRKLRQSSSTGGHLPTHFLHYT